MHTNGEDLGKETIGSHAPGTPHDAPGPGYETSDVNVKGVSVFLASLFAFVLIFFALCYGMGMGINYIFDKDDGAADKWKVASGTEPEYGKRGKTLSSNTEMEQKQFAKMAATFPEPRLDIDDGNQATADLHAREDLLLDHYSSGPDGMVRIPIERAMELIAQRGLPVAAAATPEQSFAGDNKPRIQEPLTTGFARTGFELTVIEAREQRMSYGKAESSEHAALTPAK